ncbi:S9 family peptidase [Silvibacterium sp.]|uniref:S9 family peptidase n=1 Tax=Silvibacterium sp. TaxID=1964179 RepID=UPI0039E35ED5
MHVSRFASRRPACFLALASLLLPFPCHAQKHTVQPADIAGLRSIEAPKISPDGKLIAYTVTTPMPAGKPHNEHIWLVPTDRSSSARLFVSGAGDDSSPAWSPDGRTLVFLSSRPNPLASPGSPFHFSVAPGNYRGDIPKELINKPAGAPPAQSQTPATQQKDSQPPPPAPVPSEDDEQKGMQLWSISLDGGEAQPLTNIPGGIKSFQWSKDGKHIAFLRTDADTPEESVRKKKKDDREIIDGEYHFDRLWIYDVDTHQARLLSRQDINVDSIDWSPDGTGILARVSPTPRIDDYWRVSVVEVFSTSSGEITQVIEKKSGYETPVYSLDGQNVSYSRFTQKRITDEHFIRNLSTGKDIRLEDKLDGTLYEMRWLTGNRLLVNAFVHAHTEAHIFDPATLTVTQLDHLTPTALDFDATKDGSSIAFLSETPTQPAEVTLWRADAATVLSDTNPQTKDWALGEQREVQWINPKDHRVIYGVLTLPPGYTPGKRYKTAIHIHGGPEESFTVGFSATWYNYALLLASQGYVVLQPNYRGSSGQSIDFTEANYQDGGGGDFADVMAGTDWVIQQGYADPDRMVIAGWSYGGFMTAWAVTHTDRFKAAMAGAAVTDIYSMATTTDIAPSYLDALYNVYAKSYKDLDLHSPVRFAANCHTPTLVLHGGADVRVPLGQGQEFYHALRYLNREAAMVVYPREPHIFHETEHQIDSLTRELDWFSQHLKPETTGH